MSIVELMTRCNDLESVLRRALDELQGLHSPECAASDLLVPSEDDDTSFDLQPSNQPCDCWVTEAEELLRPKPVVKVVPGTGICKLCKHEPTMHASSGKGFCMTVDCPCMEYKLK